MTIRHTLPTVFGDDDWWSKLKPWSIVDKVYASTTEESNMIGGDACHLCGAGREFEDTSETITKNNKKNFHVHQKGYKCGSKYFHSWVATENGPKKNKTNFIVGNKCLKIGNP